MFPTSDTDSTSLHDETVYGSGDLVARRSRKVETDDLVKKYLPAAPASWEKTTIYHLLSHTSGISDDAAKYVPGTTDKLEFNDTPLNFRPERWAYSNLGYIKGYLLEGSRTDLR